MVLGNFIDYFVSNSFAQTGLPSAVGDPFQSGAMAYYLSYLRLCDLLVVYFLGLV